MFFPSSIKQIIQLQQNHQQQQKKQKKLTLEQQVIIFLEINPLERNNKQHQFIWKYFNEHIFFKNIQHDKSIYAKISAIGHLRLNKISNTTINFQYSYQYTFNQRVKAILLKQDYFKIMEKNQSQIKYYTQKLNKYALIKYFTYQQLLYIVQHLQTRSYKFKQYIYHQKQLPQFIYFINEGQFHYLYEKIQDFQDYKNKQRYHLPKKQTKVLLKQSDGLPNFSLIQQKKRKKKQFKLKYEYDPNPNRKTRTKKISQKIAIISGGHGLTIGQQQILLNIPRAYSVVCMSTQNSVYILKKQHLKILLEDIPNVQQTLLKDSQRKISLKKSIMSKIQNTKLNISKYIQQISKSIEINIRQQQSQQQLQKKNNRNSSVLPQILVRSKVYSDLTKQKTKQKTQLYDQINNKKILSSISYQDEDQYQQHQSSFPLTNIIDHKIKPKKSFPENLSKQQNSNNNLLSLSQQNNYNNTIDIKIGKSWNFNKKPIIQRLEKSKYVGMIDSNMLIKQKQYILSKKNYKIMRQDIYPQQKLSTKLINKAIIIQSNRNKDFSLPQLDKQKVSVTPAHSKQYMQKLLLHALEKSGYNLNTSQKKQQRNKNYKYNHKFFEEDNQQKLESVIEDSVFDNCYFKQI